MVFKLKQLFHLVKEIIFKEKNFIFRTQTNESMNDHHELVELMVGGGEIPITVGACLEIPGDCGKPRRYFWRRTEFVAVGVGGDEVGVVRMSHDSGLHIRRGGRRRQTCFGKRYLVFDEMRRRWLSGDNR